MGTHGVVPKGVFIDHGYYGRVVCEKFICSQSRGLKSQNLHRLMHVLKPPTLFHICVSATSLEPN